MVRTKDQGNVKAVGAKAARKVTPAASAPSSSSSSDSKNKYSGGNPYCPRETPSWQKPITNFFGSSSKPSASNAEPGSPSTSVKVNSTVGTDQETPDSGSNHDVSEAENSTEDASTPSKNNCREESSDEKKS